MIKVHQVKLEDVKPRENSQREKPRGVAELKDSIQRRGLLHPIILDDDMNLIAGGNRLKAFQELAQEDSSYNSIPAFKFNDLTDNEKRLVELDENVKRVDLTWKEHCLAIVSIDNALREAGYETETARAHYVGKSHSGYGDLLRVGCALIEEHPNVINAGNLTVAINALKREKRRRADDQVNEIFEQLTSDTNREVEGDEDVYRTKDYGDDAPKTKPIVKERPVNEIECNDFIEWSKNYRGEKFNLLHCDFPYGINHGKSDQGGSKSWGAYEDNPDIYWALLKALAENIDNILLPKSHIIFWFSMKYYTETIEFFNKHIPDCDVDYQPLVWMKTDNKGIIRNVNHTPRNICETALFITRGKREIIKAVGNAYGAPTQKASGTHVSEKPVPVLRHFMQLCCDGFTKLLDPTCGSGSALRAADSMGAQKIYGMDLNEQYAETAASKLKDQRAIEKLHKTHKEE